MQVLVTGGAGFIGSQVVEAYAAAGHQVRVLDLQPPPDPTIAEYVAGDVRDCEVVDRALAGVDLVNHQAAMVGLGVDLAGDLPAYVGCNDLGTAVLLAAMARHEVPRLVLASSMVVYGEGGYRCATDGPVRPAARADVDLAAGSFEPRCPHCRAELTTQRVTEDARLDPRNVYAATKVAQEHLAAAWARGTGGSVVALRYHNVYGPRMPRDTPYAGVASIFRSALRRGECPRVFEDGRQLRDFVHVRDVAAANLHAASHTVEASALTAYNVASGEPHTVGELAHALADACGGPRPVVTGDYRLGDVRHIVASSDRITRELGYAAQVSFVYGMREFAALSVG
ncbi:MAG: NAD-dependent epimerase/dehydratase family protein [Streptosporangiales bacterium]|nr:NAD-dependent epimerase/dehydratase family protein [Streptosporangiales bacterium]